MLSHSGYCFIIIIIRLEPHHRWSTGLLRIVFHITFMWSRAHICYEPQRSSDTPGLKSCRLSEAAHLEGHGQFWSSPCASHLRHNSLALSVFDAHNTSDSKCHSFYLPRLSTSSVGPSKGQACSSSSRYGTLLYARAGPRRHQDSERGMAANVRALSSPLMSQLAKAAACELKSVEKGSRAMLWPYS